MSRLRGEVVAVLLTHRGRVCLLRRSARVLSDRGRWHCVTGFLPPHTAAGAQAAAEVFEETGIRGAELSFVAGPVLRLDDPRGGHWMVHPYRCEVAGPGVTLNWENDAVRWLHPTRLGEMPIVGWLPDVAAAVLDGNDEGSTSWDA